MIVIKRDGKREEFNQNKISLAIAKAVNSMDSKKITDVEINEIVVTVMQECKVFGEMSVEVIQDRVEDLLYKLDKSVAKGYKAYRLQRTEIRDKKSPLMKSINNIARKDDASSVDNANVGSNFSAKLLGIASEGNKWTILALLPKWIAHLHLDGRLYQHDLDAYNLTINCLHLKTGEILKRGFNASYGPISEPHRIMSAAALSCILIQSSQNRINLCI